MNQEEADQDVVDEVSEEADSRGEAMRSQKNEVIFKDERVGGRATVTTDEDHAHSLHVDILHVEFYMSLQCGRNESSVCRQCGLGITWRLEGQHASHTGRNG